MIPDADYYDEEDEYCLHCDGLGMILVCIDDICRGLGHCMDEAGGREPCSDGYATCPECGGDY